MRKRNFTSLEVLVEQVWKAKLQIFASQGRAEVRKQNSHIWQLRQSRSAELELHIFGSQCRAKVRTWNFRSLAVKTKQKRNFRSLAVKAEQKWNIRSLSVKAEQKCGSEISDL